VNCLQCGKDTSVINTRPYRDGQSIRRRRKCLSCGYRFTTYEYATLLGKWLNMPPPGMIQSLTDSISEIGELADSIVRSTHLARSISAKIAAGKEVG
jgi:hypothetical protein